MAVGPETLAKYLPPMKEASSIWQKGYEGEMVMRDCNWGANLGCSYSQKFSISGVWYQCIVKCLKYSIFLNLICNIKFNMFFIWLHPDYLIWLFFTLCWLLVAVTWFSYYLCHSFTKHVLIPFNSSTISGRTTAMKVSSIFSLTTVTPSYSFYEIEEHVFLGVEYLTPHTQHGILYDY